jgi:hypothetical protein
MLTPVMLGIVALSMLVAGSMLAVRAESNVESAAQLECAVGIFIVGGLSLLGIGLAWALNPMTFMSP